MSISAQKMAVAATTLSYPGRVPVFYLPSASSDGGQAGPAATRSKYNLVLAFVEGSLEGEEYLQAFSTIHRDILSRAARLIAVTSLPLNEARALAQRLNLPYMLLADDGATTTHRLLSDDVNAALCVADRYGIVYYLQTAPATSALPPAQVALDWLDYVQVQCPECTDGSDSRWAGGD
jgi:peroxiredoxin